MDRVPVLADSFGRVMRDLRVSLTDRCNFRCLYCLPETEAAANFYRGKFNTAPVNSPRLHPPEWKPRAQILTFEEVERLVRIFIGLGVTKVRLTGGEPLLRQDLERVVGKIAALPGLADLAMTTNGFLFSKKAAMLKAAGLRRVSFSMDSVRRDNFLRMTGRDALQEVQQSIRIAQELGLHPVKVNAVIIRGINHHEIEDLAEFARDRDLSLRFIEFMPLDSTRAWMKDMVVTGREILNRLQSRFDLAPLKPDNPSETARRWTFAGGRGEIGIIAPVSEPFCGHCNRVRLTADGKIRTCLFSVAEHDIKGPLRNGATDEEIEDRLRTIIWGKEPRHRIGEPDFVHPDRSMSCIGG